MRVLFAGTRHVLLDVRQKTEIYVHDISNLCCDKNVDIWEHTSIKLNINMFKIACSSADAPVRRLRGRLQIIRHWLDSPCTGGNDGGIARIPRPVPLRNGSTQAPEEAKTKPKLKNNTKEIQIVTKQNCSKLRPTHQHDHRHASSRNKARTWRLCSQLITQPTARDPVVCRPQNCSARTEFLICFNNSHLLPVCNLLTSAPSSPPSWGPWGPWEQCRT